MNTVIDPILLVWENSSNQIVLNKKGVDTKEKNILWTSSNSILQNTKTVYEKQSEVS